MIGPGEYGRLNWSPLFAAFRRVLAVFIRRRSFDSVARLIGLRPFCRVPLARVGPLDRLRGLGRLSVLIDAFAQVADQSVSLVLAGPDQVGWQAELQRRVESLKLQSRVVFAGMLQGEMKQAAFTVADAFVLPSHQENFGMAVVEALAIGLPLLLMRAPTISRQGGPVGRRPCQWMRETHSLANLDQSGRRRWINSFTRDPQPLDCLPEQHRITKRLSGGDSEKIEIERHGSAFDDLRDFEEVGVRLRRILERGVVRQ